MQRFGGSLYNLITCLIEHMYLEDSNISDRSWGRILSEKQIWGKILWMR